MKIRKLTFLLIPTLAIISATGCNKNVEELTLFDANSRFIGTLKPNLENPNVQLPETFDNLNIAPLQTYHLRGKGDVPYVELSQLVSALNVGFKDLITNGMKCEVKSDGYHITSGNGKGEMILNAETDIVKFKDSGSFVEPTCVENNSVTGDYCTFRGNSIRPSEKSKVYSENGSAIPEYETYSFKDYGFDIYKKEDKYYAPFESVTKLIYREIGIDCSYNGSEFYSTALGSFTSSLVKSSNGYWTAASGIYAPDRPDAGDAYRFHFSFTRPVSEGSTEMETVTKFLVLHDNESKSGNVVLCRGTTYDSSQILPDTESNFF